MPTKIKLLAGLNTAFLLFFSLSLFAQNAITGRVLNSADRQPVVGATVQAKGGKSATTTASDGTFTLTSNQKVSAVVITIVGYDSKTISVTGNTIGEVLLSTSITNLNDVIVTGYTTQKKKDITGSVAIVDVGDAKKINTTSSEQLLQGQASGVTVINSGAPGADAFAQCPAVEAALEQGARFHVAHAAQVGAAGKSQRGADRVSEPVEDRGPALQGGDHSRLLLRGALDY